MSSLLLRQVIDHSPSKYGARLVLMILAHLADDADRATVPIPFLSAQSGFSNRRLRRTLGELQAAGAIGIKPGSDPGESDTYTVHPPRDDRARRA